MATLEIEHDGDGFPTKETTMVNGQRHGPYRTLRRNGRPAFTANYTNDELDNERRWWHSNGMLQEEYTENGHRVWNAFGQLLEEKQKTGPGSSVIRRWYSTGAKEQETFYERGHHVHGTCRFWHPNEQLSKEETYVDDLLEGPVCKWHSNGILAEKYVSVRGKEEGLFQRWHDNGQMAEETRFSDGRIRGHSQLWDRDGVTIGYGFFYQGRPCRFWTIDQHREAPNRAKMRNILMALRPVGFPLFWLVAQHIPMW